MSSWSPAATTRSKSRVAILPIPTTSCASAHRPATLPPASANTCVGVPDPSLFYRIQEHLLYSLNAHSNNWPTQIQNRALALLRSGDAQTFPALLRQILEEVRKETALEPSSKSDGSANGNSNGSSETVQVNGSGSGGKKATANGSSAPGPGEASNLHTNTSTSLAVPQSVVDDALKITKEALMAVAEFDEENGAT